MCLSWPSLFGLWSGLRRRTRQACSQSFQDCTEQNRERPSRARCSCSSMTHLSETLPCLRDRFDQGRAVIVFLSIARRRTAKVPGIRRRQRTTWWHQCADSDEVAQAYRYEVARGFRDDVAHLSDLISPSGEAFWPAGSLASVKPRGQSGIATSTLFSSFAVAVGMWATRLRCPSAAACPQRSGRRIAGFGAGSHR